MWIDYEVALFTLELSPPITTEFLLGLLEQSFILTVLHAYDFNKKA